jgi:DNA-binding transcriptional LysR family regulator
MDSLASAGGRPADLALMRTFLAVYRAGSLTGAKARLGLSQPTITAQIRSLEAQLGQQLFQRLPRGVAPTSVADELAREIAVHVDALTAIAERGVLNRDPFARPVHLAGPAEFITVRVLPALADLTVRGLKLRVTFGLAEDLLAELTSSRFDVVISTVRPRGRAVAATPLVDEEFVLVAAPVWAARIDRARIEREPGAALRGAPLITYAEDLPIIRRYWRVIFGVRVSSAAAVVVPDLRGVLASVRAGAGVTVAPRYLCERELAAGDLVLLHRPTAPPTNTLFFATRAGTEDLPHIATVRGRLLSRASDW